MNSLPSNDKLFAVYLGGSALRSNTELHDVVFVTGEKIEDTYEQLMELWFGIPDGLHIDSWIELSVIDGHAITLSEEPSGNPLKLFFINMGAYVPGQLMEVHSNEFFISDNKIDVIKRAKEGCLKGSVLVHRDYIYDVDECLEVGKVGRYFVHLAPTDKKVPFDPVNAYHLIPRELIKEFKSRKRL